ncbi:MAG: hypothetical protein IKK03_09425, partial [Lachnospiraceae bacterium]|nr:hypothetical protein [Lachnospiraceae bacterium]
YTSHKSEDFNTIAVGTLAVDDKYAMKESLGKNGRLQAYANSIIAAVNVSKGENADNIAIKLVSNAKTKGNALCQIDLESSFSYKKVKINYSIYVNDIPSIADSSAFPKITNRDSSVSAYPIKLTVATDTDGDGVKTGQIQYLNQSGEYQDIQEYSTNAWYDFSFVLNLTSQTYDLYINNQKMLNEVQLVTAQGNSMDYIRNIAFQISSDDDASTSSTSILLDDLSVEVPATNE